MKTPTSGFEISPDNLSKSGLTGLGIEQHYHFTAHITLGYFGDLSPNLDRDRLASTIFELNQQWLETPQFWVHRAELRKFDDMTLLPRA